MPTILTHALVPLAAGAVLGPARLPLRWVVAGAVMAMLPDADVIGLWLGVPYGSAFGHRGASHSLAFSVLVGLLGAMLAGRASPSRLRVGLWLAACTASHPLLDALTDGGLGVALWWPWSEARVFAPWRPIGVSPIGGRFFGVRGLEVLASEARTVWLPAAALVLLAGLGRHAKRGSAQR